MEKLRIPRKSWVLVCDGAKALFLRNDGDAELLNLIPAEIRDIETDTPSDSASDRPGRVHQSQGEARSAIEAVTPEQQAEEAFLAESVRRLDELVRDHAIEHLTIVAPPKVLGIVRKHLTPAAHAIVLNEVAKDFTMLPIPEIEKRLSA